MKRFLLPVLLCIALLSTLPAGAEEAPGSTRVLVACFSRTGENYGVGRIEKGNTAILAEMIAEETGADLFAITPVTPYPEAYDEATDVAAQEQAEDARPEMTGSLTDLDAYDVIFVGYPIWWGDMPMILYTFLESVDFTGKTVVPFNTHEGSGQGGTVARLKALLPDANVLDGFAVRGATAQNDPEAARRAVTAYLADLELP